MVAAKIHIREPRRFQAHVQELRGFGLANVYIDGKMRLKQTSDVHSAG